ncbi:MAG: hypothetical protein NTY19_33440 [Planctomycetota bacterium]|nr:hypothetical protein [Planctomycetota bacterium]
MQSKFNALRARIRHADQPRRLAVELLETRQLLSLSPALPGALFEHAERIALAADESLHDLLNLAFVSDDLVASIARPFPVDEVGEKPHSEFFPIQPMVIVSVLPRGPDAPAWEVESWAGRDLLLARVPGPEGEAQERLPPASDASLDFAMLLFPGRSPVIEVSHLTGGLKPILPPPPRAAMLDASPFSARMGSDADDAPAATGMPKLQNPTSDRSGVSPNTILTSLPASSTGGREVGSIVVDSLGTAGLSSLSQIAAQFDAQDVTRTNGLGWQVPNVERPLLPNADTVRTEPYGNRISPRTEDGYIDLQTIKSRETAAVLVTGDVPSRSTAWERQADEQHALSALDADLSWRLLTLYRQDSDADQDGDHFDAESPSDGLASSDLALSVEVMRVLRLELPDDTEDGGMVVIAAPGMSSFLAANPTDGPMAVGNSQAESSNAAGNGVEMDVVCGRSQAFEVSGANAVSAPPAATRRVANDSAAPPEADRVHSSPPSSASAAVDDPQAAGPHRAVVLPLLLALLPQFLTGRRRRNAASTPELEVGAGTGS